eukprot:TRINITY_DN10971_c0_g2_i2.p1 TRINITY_DN10971_c0_g2~~TRINITY_DN10971_c0_g2_i2.p1  ORF type:complete len:207 (+),score=64.40 TRINITY_DN10971_c0_g2_i2:96-716(+)
MIRRPPRSTLSSSSAASDVYKRQYQRRVHGQPGNKQNQEKKQKVQKNQSTQETQSEEQQGSNDVQISNLMKLINDESIFQQEPTFEIFDNIINQLQAKMQYINGFMDDLQKENFTKLQDLNLQEEEKQAQQQEQPSQKLSQKQKQNILNDVKNTIAKLESKEKSLSEIMQKEENQSLKDDMEKLAKNLCDDIEQKKEFQTLIETQY